MARGKRPLRRSTIVLVLAVAAASIVVLAIVVALALQPRETRAAPSPAPVPSSSPSPSPIDQNPQNTEDYDLAALPVVDVFAIAATLPVDDAPLAPPLPMVATPKASGTPLFPDPHSAPVGVLPAQLTFDGTTVPVLERDTHWAKIMLSGRAGYPSGGVTGQLTAWVRATDVDIVPSRMSVRVSLSTPSIQILDGDAVVYETGEAAIGSPATPTPIGRTFIMTSRIDPEAGFTRGHPIVYLGLQSPTLDGFDGQDNAITAFHYHDARQGAISNGCLRVSAESIEKLAALPLGTAVVITA